MLTVVPTSVIVPVALIDSFSTSPSTNPLPPTVTSGFVNGFPSYSLEADPLVNVTGLFVIVSFSVPVNSPVYFSLVTRTFIVLVSLTFVAVISDGFVVQLPSSAIWYSILTSATYSPVTLSFTFAVPAS